MTRFTDGNKVIEISITDKYGETWERLFFRIDELPYNRKKHAFQVANLDKLVKHAHEVLDATNAHIQTVFLKEA